MAFLFKKKVKKVWWLHFNVLSLKCQQRQTKKTRNYENSKTIFKRRVE